MLPTSAYYLAVDLGCLSVPLLCSFHPKIRFDKTWGTFLPALLMTAAVFLAWDSLFTQRGIWGFNPHYLLGIRIGNLPLEEALFFLCIPYACVFTYFCVRKFWDASSSNSSVIAPVLAAILFLFAASYPNRSYTLWASAPTAALLLFLFLRRWPFFRAFFLSFLLCLIPFIASDAFLTGTGLPHPIVWYDNSQNSGFRLLTIPLEDFPYGLLLILMNVALFERLERLRKPQ